MRRTVFDGLIGILSAAALAAAAGTGGCAGAPLRLPTAEELSSAGAPTGGADFEALRRGRAVFVRECAACHRLFAPDEYTPDQWREIVPRMAGRASLSGEQTADLYLYLSVASRRRKE